MTLPVPCLRLRFAIFGRPVYFLGVNSLFYGAFSEALAVISDEEFGQIEVDGLLLPLEESKSLHFSHF